MSTGNQLALPWAGEALPALALEYARAGRIRIAPALPAPQAEALHHHLDRDAAWSRALNRGEQTWDLGPDSIEKLAREGDAHLLAVIHRQARDGFQFLFDTVRVSESPAQRRARDTPLDRVIENFNSPPLLNLFRRLTGCPDISMVDGQATRYLAGHFLTAHDDAVNGKGRVAAYVLNLTPRWRTEWGGLLQFHRPDGDLEDAWLPRFNVMNLFRVPQLHSVSYVSPFAGAPRYAITGWLRRA